MHVMQAAILVFLVTCMYVRGHDHPHPGEGFFQCGHYHCTNESQVTCENGKCSCGPNEIGNPRIQCAHPDEHCLCLLEGDPHVNNFNGDTFQLPLPCTHMIADLTTPSSYQVPGGCQVVIVGLAHFAEHARDPLVSFESEIDILVLTRQSRYTSRIVKGRQPETSFVKFKRRRPTDIEVIVFEEDGFYIMDIEACEVVIKYSPSSGSFSLLTPVGSIDSAGLCGECTPEYAGSSQHRPPTPLEWLKLLIDSLWGYSPIDYRDINVYPTCSELTDRIQDCTPDRKDFALEFCGHMLLEKSVIECIADQYGPRQVEMKFSDCYNSVCSGLKTCSEFAALYHGCNTTNLGKFLNNGTFCSPNNL